MGHGGKNNRPVGKGVSLGLTVLGPSPIWI